MYFRGKQKGVALITVLLIVSLASIVATEMTARLQMQLQRSSNINLNQQAYWYAIAAEAYAKLVLIESFRSEPDKTTQEQLWAQGEQTSPVDGGQISGEISDMQGCFNLNSVLTVSGSSSSGAGGVVKKTAEREALERLITSLEVDGVSAFEAEYMVDALKDWLDKDSMISSSGGAEDDDYSGREFPYLAGNTYLASINELRVIEHFTVPVINALKQYACVIPDNGAKININTLSEAKTLAALLNVSEDDASDILGDVPSDGFKGVAEFFALSSLSSVQLTADQKKMFVVDSDYFKLKAMTQFNESFFAVQSIMKVNNNKDISVIHRSVGFFNE